MDNMDTFWNIFYHTSIPCSDLERLQAHAGRLADASKSLSAWAASPFGTFLTFLSNSTLTQLHRFWLQYSNTRNMSPAELTAFDERMKATVLKTVQDQVGDNLVTNGLRMAGAHYFNAVQVVKLALMKYSQTGVVGGNERDRSLLGNNGNGHANPTFAFSSAPTSAYTVHYGSNPLDGFHLAEAFDHFNSPSLALEDAVRVAQSQFRVWCDSFLKTIKENRVQITLHCGDAINLCHVLQDLNVEGASLSYKIPLYLGPWTSIPLIFDGPARPSGKILFDVIDTSNVTDHLGILNVLPATVPLLRYSASSVLYTEALMCPSANPVQSLDADLHSDTATMAILMGLSPCEYLLGDTAYSNAVEKVTGSVKKSYYRVQTAWRFPELGDAMVHGRRESCIEARQKVQIDAKDLGSFLLNLYLKLFAYDKIDMLTEAIQAKLDFVPPPHQPQYNVVTDGRSRYNNAGFAAILRTATDTMTTDWHTCFAHIISRIQSYESLSIINCGTQELVMHLRSYGVNLTADSATRSAIQAMLPDAMSPLGSSSQVPKQIVSTVSILYLAFVVPRNVLGKFRSVPHNKIGNPGLKLSISHKASGRMHTFFSIQCFFGSLEPNATDESMRDVSEDSLGWAGSSNLIVTCPILSTSLFRAPADTVNITLALNDHLCLSFIEDLFGPGLVIWECALSDTAYVHILREAPMSGRFEKSVQPPAMSSAPSSSTTSVTAYLGQADTIEALCFHDAIPNDSKQSEALAEGARVAVFQSSPCTMSYQIGTNEPQVLIYPFPLNGSLAKTKLARKSSWIELTVPLSMAGANGGYNSSPFPIVLIGSDLSCWATPRINVHRQSVISPKGDLEWLQFHMASALTDVEKSTLTRHPRSSPTRPKNGKLDLKQTMNLVVTAFAGCNV